MSESTTATPELCNIVKADATRHIRLLGNFTVNSGVMRFSDPCYDDNTWCNGSMPAVNGTWNARIGFFRDSWDEGNLLEGINQYKFLKELTEKFKDNAHIWTLRKIVSNVRNSRTADNNYKNSDAILEAIAEVENEDERADLKELADFSIQWFEPHHGKNSYWEKGTWVMFQISSGLSCDQDLRSFSSSVETSYILRKMNSLIDDEKISEGEKNKKLDELKKRLAALRIGQGTALSNKIKELEELHASGKPFRTLYLHVKHSSVEDFTSPKSTEWHYNDQFDVGVDSGQAGFFDAGWFTEYSKGKSESHSRNRDSEWDKTYGMLCTLSSGPESHRNAKNPNKEEGGVFEFGANSYTAHGDGSAPMFYRLNDKGEVIESIYHYEPDCDEDEDGEEDEGLSNEATQAASESTVSTTIEDLKHSNSQKKEGDE